MSNEKVNELIPYLILEEYLKKEYLEDIKKIDEFLNYISSYFDVKKKDIKVSRTYNGTIMFDIPAKDRNFYKICFTFDGKIENNLMVVSDITYNSTTWEGRRGDIKTLMFKNSKKTREFLKYFSTEFKYTKDSLLIFPHLPATLKTSNSKYLLEIESIYLDHISIYLLDKNGNRLFGKNINANDEEEFLIKNKTIKEKYSKEEFIKLLLSLNINISLFPKNEIKKMNQFYIDNIHNSNKIKEEKLNECNQKQTTRVKLAYQMLKEIAELLTDTRIDMNFDKIKIDNLREILFKNSGNPTEKGYIEFNNFFRNNQLLRMIDLSNLDLTNVDITHMDFSGTNVKINPQTIYNQDMTGVIIPNNNEIKIRENFNDIPTMTENCSSKAKK